MHGAQTKAKHDKWTDRWTDGDRRKDIQIDDGQSKPYVVLCFAGPAEKKNTEEGMAGLHSKTSKSLNHEKQVILTRYL